MTHLRRNDPENGPDFGAEVMGGWPKADLFCVLCIGLLCGRSGNATQLRLRPLCRISELYDARFSDTQRKIADPVKPRMSSEDDFYNALFEGDIPVLDELSERVSDLPWAAGDTGRDVLITAISWSNENSVKWVLSKKPAINFVDDQGFTTLKHVLQIEIDSDVFHKRSQTELTQVTIRLIDLLIEAGADINLSGTLGESILHTAAMWSSPTVIRHLLARGADPMLFDDEYESRQPIYYAEFFKRWDAHAVLQEAMKTHHH